jgi:hypothetical protein
MISEWRITSQEVVFPNKTPCSLQVPTFLPNTGTYLQPHGVTIQNTVIPQLRELKVLFLLKSVVAANDKQDNKVIQIQRQSVRQP